MNELLGSLHRERIARLRPRETTYAVSGGGGRTLRIIERPGEHIGSHIWPGSEVLLNYLLFLLEELDLQGKTLLELGSGIGLLGISLAGSTSARGAHVIVTDRDTGILIRQE